LLNSNELQYPINRCVLANFQYSKLKVAIFVQQIQQ
jgi:hypothetical protein